MCIIPCAPRYASARRLLLYCRCGLFAVPVRTVLTTRLYAWLAYEEVMPILHCRNGVPSHCRNVISLRGDTVAGNGQRNPAQFLS